MTTVFLDRLDRALTRLRAARAWASFDENSVLGEGARIFSTAYCTNLGDRDAIQIGERFVCRGTLRREVFGGTLTIGNDVYIGDYSLVSCGDRVSIGNNVAIAFNVCIFDNDSHPISVGDRITHVQRILESGFEDGAPIAHAPVAIHDGAWIGFGVTIMKGVTVGEGAIVGAGSVVTADVPPHTVVAGNPARVVREIQ